MRFFFFCIGLGGKIRQIFGALVFADLQERDIEKNKADNGIRERLKIDLTANKVGAHEHGNAPRGVARSAGSGCGNGKRLAMRFTGNMGKKPILHVGLTRRMVLKTIGRAYAAVSCSEKSCAVCHLKGRYGYVL